MQRKFWKEFGIKKLQSLIEYLKSFFVLAHIPYTASEIDPDYYHQKLNKQVASQVAENFKS